MIHEPWKEVMYIDFPFKAENSTVLFYAYLLFMGLYVDCHLLERDTNKNEASLMKVEVH